MSIEIGSSDELEQLRTRLRRMSDEELVRFGKAARKLCRDPRCPDAFKLQLEEPRAECLEGALACAATPQHSRTVLPCQPRNQSGLQGRR